jgi:PEGA domain-containing protein
VLRPGSLALFVALGAIPLRAGARAIAVVPLIASGSVDGDDLFEAGEVVAATLRERGHDVLGPVEAGEQFDERIPGCIASHRAACWMQAAEALARDSIVHGRVSRDSTSGAASVTLTAIDARDGRVLVESSHQGVARERPALVALARTAAAHLSDEMPALQLHPRLRVETQPSGASLAVNGNPVGRTPWSAELAEGACVVQAHVAGFRPAVREVTLTAGESRTLTILLQPGEEARRRAGWQLPVGIGGIVLGGVGAAVGMTQLLRDDCLDSNADGTCGREIGAGQRLGFGLVPLVLGLATATAGVLVGWVLELESAPSDER